MQGRYLAAVTPTEFSDFHRRAADYFGKADNPIEALYHQFFYERDSAYDLWQVEIEEAVSRYEYARQETLYAISLAKEIFCLLTKAQQADCWFRRGEYHYYLGENQRAYAAYQAALEHYQTLNDPRGTANTLLSLGDLEANLGNATEADRLYNSALRQYLILQEPMGQMNCYLSLARLSQQEENSKQALKHYQAVLTIATQIGFGEHPVILHVKAEMQSLNND